MIKSIVEKMSPTMIRSLRQVEEGKGALLHGQQRDALEWRGLLQEDLYGSISLTADGRAVLDYVRSHQNG